MNRCKSVYFGKFLLVLLKWWIERKYFIRSKKYKKFHSKQKFHKQKHLTFTFLLSKCVSRINSWLRTLASIETNAVLPVASDYDSLMLLVSIIAYFFTVLASFSAPNRSIKVCFGKYLMIYAYGISSGDYLLMRKSKKP